MDSSLSRPLVLLVAMVDVSPFHFIDRTQVQQVRMTFGIRMALRIYRPKKVSLPEEVCSSLAGSWTGDRVGKGTGPCVA